MGKRVREGEDGAFEWGAGREERRGVGFGFGAPDDGSAGGEGSRHDRLEKEPSSAERRDCLACSSGVSTAMTTEGNASVNQSQVKIKSKSKLKLKCPHL